MVHLLFLIFSYHCQAIDTLQLPVANGHVYHPKTDTTSLCRKRNGIYISATSDFNVKSVHQGRVVKIFSMPSGESYAVAIASGGSYFFYGQIYKVSVKPGQTVQKGQIIGELSQQQGLNNLLLFSVYRHGKEVNEENLLRTGQ
jgi:murein DD-endopeptidase MepM/ murein hydrolase activator NlpD